MNDTPHSPRDRAADLQLDACLHELAGLGPNPALSARILEAAARGRPLFAPRPAIAGRHTHWLFAAALLLGTGVVASVAWLRNHESQAPAALPAPQDPAPAPKPAPKPWYTLVADYSENRVVEYDEQGKVTFELDEVFGAWDAEALANGNVLMTEFSVSRVREVDRTGKTVWTFEDLKNPYDADRLPNGNTLIADVLKDRVIEVSPVGEIVWEVKNMPNCHDADRLKNGNTLITLRNKGAVVEVDADGQVLWELKNLSSPSDADRLPNGNTLVAENTRVREFDRDGKVVAEIKAVWAVEANRYQR